MRDDTIDYGYDADTDGYGRDGRRGGWSGLGDFIVDYIRSRRIEHWIMFLAGAFFGAIIA